VRDDVPPTPPPTGQGWPTRRRDSCAAWAAPAGPAGPVRPPRAVKIMQPPTAAGAGGRQQDAVDGTGRSILRRALWASAESRSASPLAVNKGTRRGPRRARREAPMSAARPGASRGSAPRRLGPPCRFAADSQLGGFACRGTPPGKPPTACCRHGPSDRAAAPLETGPPPPRRRRCRQGASWPLC
jgi:hypothetical protein